MSEKNNYIITMKDGGIIDIATDNWCEYSGCENILIVRVCPDGTYGEVVHEMGELKEV